MSLFKNNPNVTGGDFDQPATFYTIDQSPDADGAPQNIPVLAFTAIVAVAPYFGILQQSADRMVGESWATICVQYAKSRPIVEGMQVVLKRTNERFEIRFVSDVQYLGRKLELTCRMMR